MTGNSIRLDFLKMISRQSPWKIFDISAMDQVVPDLLKAFTILSDTNVKRSAVEQEDLIFLEVINKHIT